MIDPLKDTPKDVTEMLLRWGGKNPYGLANWRIIRAENELVLRSGVWTQFEPETERTQFTPTSAGLHYEHREIAPESVREGTFWVPRWAVNGWILERWFPASSFGSELAWREAQSRNGEAMMGDWPAQGDYWFLSGGGPWEEIPPMEGVRLSISNWENSAHLHGYMDEEAIARAVDRDCQEQQEREDKRYFEFLEEVKYQRETHLAFINSNPALCAARNRILNRAGIMSHS